MLTYVAMSSGNIEPGISIPLASPGHQVPFATAIKVHTGLTAMAVGMIAKPDQAEAIIANGEAFAGSATQYQHRILLLEKVEEPGLKHLCCGLEDRLERLLVAQNPNRLSRRPRL